MKRLIFLFLILLLASGAMAQDTTSITWKWSPPTVGTTPVSYGGEIMVADGPDTSVYIWSQASADTTFKFTNYVYGTSIRMRVQATDVNDIPSILSIWAEWFVSWGQPGEVGVPIVIMIGDEPIE